MTETTNKPTTEERYTSAIDATNLRVEADRSGDADFLIASGWSQSRIGSALMRLHSEWDGAEKPRRALPGPKVTKQECTDWYIHEVKILLGKLKTLPEVRQQVAIQAAKWMAPDPLDTAAAVVAYWLDQTCHVCEGRKFQSIPGTPGLSIKHCQACQGTGLGKVPHGPDGRKLLNWIDECVHCAQASIKHRLRQFPHGA